MFIFDEVDEYHYTQKKKKRSLVMKLMNIIMIVAMMSTLNNTHILEKY